MKFISEFLQRDVNIIFFNILKNSIIDTILFFCECEVIRKYFHNYGLKFQVKEGAGLPIPFGCSMCCWKMTYAERCARRINIIVGCS